MCCGKLAHDMSPGWCLYASDNNLGPVLPAGRAPAPLLRRLSIIIAYSLIMPHPGSASSAKGLRDRNSPTCTLSQNGYGDAEYPRVLEPRAPGNQIPNV